MVDAPQSKRRSSGEDASHAAGGRKTVTGNFYNQRNKLLELIEIGKIDFNELSPTGKQAALSLQQEARVKVVPDAEGRLKLEKHAPSFWWQLITAGLVR